MFASLFELSFLVWPTRLVVLAMVEVLSFGFNLAVLDPSDRGNDMYCIVAIEDKKMGFISYCLSLYLYIMSSCLMCYPVHETYAPQVYSPSYKFPIYFTLQSLLSIYIIKIAKIFILLLLPLSDLTLISDREWIDNPFIALVARFLFVCVGTRRLACSLLLD